MVSEDFSGFILPTSLERFYTLQESADMNNWTSADGMDHLRGNGALQSMASGSFSPGSFFRLLVQKE
jgi:hypothetical protein